LLTTYDPGGNVRGVTAIGDYLFATNGRDGLVILDISDPRSEITEVGFVDEMENAVDVAVSGNYAYVADADRDPLGGWVRVVDIESPDNPVIVGVVPVSSPERIAVSGNQVYVATLSDGMQVFDISDPENPANMGEYDSDGAVHKVTMSGDYAYVSDDSLGMRIVDISDPANPEEIGSYDTPGSTRNIFLEDTLAYIADGGSGLRIVDVSDPAEPDEIGFIEVEGYCSNVAVDGGYAYVTIGQPYREPFEQVISGMYAIDVSDPASPEMMSFYDAVRSVNGIAISDNYAFLTVFSWGLVVLDISDPDNLEEVAFLEEEDGANNSIYISGNYAFIADAELLTIVDISDPTDPEVVSYWGEAWSTDVTVQGDYAFIADSEGLKILDVSDPTQPSIAGGYDTPGYAWGVAVNGNIVCVADLTNLGVYNCSAVLGINDKPKPVPMDFKLLSVYPNPFNPNTSIAIAMPERSFLSINVINIFGQQVAELVTGRYSPGYHEFSFDGAGLSSGIYFIHANVPGKMDEVRKIVLMR
ncbi:MAG: T9SS type A sorting domain-containing protein, partial [Candidatus Electryonea clarkiae]|nr:T9SS type A sorting domain-containing protein [Candidatus Electryonea clarkiae]